MYSLVLINLHNPFAAFLSLIALQLDVCFSNSVTYSFADFDILLIEQQ